LLKTLFSHRWFHPVLLLIWIMVGASLRFTHLDGKPPWTDEFATLVFSLGNSFKTVPLNQVIPLDTLLSPLHPNPSAAASDVIHHLITEDHHPPLYFVLVHWWMQLFPASDGYVSLWAARSLPALFGVASIPAAYGLGYLAFRSILVAQLSAALIAVSPYGIFLTQEARHYALAILWVIASLSCLVVALQQLNRQKPLPIWIALCWIVVNSLGMATHYFFSLTLCAQAIALIAFAVLRNPTKLKLKDPLWKWQKILIPASWWRILAVASGTFVGCLVWLPVWQTSHNSQMTEWIMTNNRTILSFINPIFQSLAAWITMVCLLPVETPSIAAAIASGVVMLAFFIFAIPIVYRGIKALLGQPEQRLGLDSLGGFVLGAIALFFSITYILGTDLTRGARYNFVYFPAVPILIAAALILGQTKTTNLKWRHISIIWIVSLLSGITVVNNLGYQKYYRPDLLLPIIQRASKVPVVIATTHNTLVQTGEMMGLAWEFKHTTNLPKSAPQFLLAHQNQDRCEGTTCPASTTLQQTIAQLPKPLDLWLVNFKAPTQPEPPNCFAEDTSQYQNSVNGYSARLYHCLPADAQATQRL
jgi:uncharacterized membrane protein